MTIDYHYPPLTRAYQSGKREEALRLVKSGADLDAGDIDGNPVLFDACAKNDVAFLHTLIEYGADVNVQNCEGFTALHNAAGNGHTECVSALYEAGADLNRATLDGETALMRAASKSELGSVKQLIALGADPNQVDCRGECALLTACNQTAFMDGDIAVVDELVKHTRREVWEQSADRLLRFDVKDTMLPYIETAFDRLALENNVPGAETAPKPKSRLRL